MSSSSEGESKSSLRSSTSRRSIQEIMIASRQNSQKGDDGDSSEESLGYPPRAQVKSVIEKLTTLHPNGPPDDEERHYVLVSIFITKMENFNSAEESVFIEFSLVMWWRDKNLVGKFGNDFDVTKIWYPDAEIVSTFKLKSVPEHDKGTYWIADPYSKYGIINYYVKYRATLHVPLELQKFPFDQQVINLRVTSRSWSIQNAEFVSMITRENLKDMLENMDMQEWDMLLPLEVFEEQPFSSEDKRNYPQICLEIQLKRKTGYYLKNIIFLVMLISIMEWAVFFLDPTALDSRLSIGVTLFLAAVAFNFVIAEEIPKVSHSTNVSKYFMVTYTSLMLSIVQNVISLILANNVSVEVAKIFDWVFLAAYGAVVVIYSVTLSIIGQKRGKKEPHQFPPNDTKP